MDVIERWQTIHPIAKVFVSMLFIGIGLTLIITKTLIFLGIISTILGMIGYVMSRKEE